jgi:hypothetical protein
VASTVIVFPTERISQRERAAETQIQGKRPAQLIDFLDLESPTLDSDSQHKAIRNDSTDAFNNCIAFSDAVRQCRTLKTRSREVSPSNMDTLSRDLAVFLRDRSRPTLSNNHITTRTQK